MGRNAKKGPKPNVFKVAGAKSLKKSKAKTVQLGLKNIKQKVQDIDKQLIELNKTPKSTPPAPSKAIPPKKKMEKPVSKEEIAKTADAVVKMDL